MSANGNEGLGPSRCYAIHRAAGEMYGRLSDALGFGDLSMRSCDTGFVFRWVFNAKGQRHTSEWAVLDFELSEEYIWTIAENVAESWKNEHRKIDA
jgi:hypothetical protein